jgi:hypothetical protein
VDRFTNVVSRLPAAFWEIAKSSVPTVPFAEIDKLAAGVVADDRNDSNGVVELDENTLEIWAVIAAPAPVLLTVKLLPEAVGEKIHFPVIVGEMDWSRAWVASDRVAVVATPLLAVSPIKPEGLANPVNPPGRVVHTGAAETVPVPVCARNCTPVEVLPASAEIVLAADPYHRSPSTAVLGILTVDHNGAVLVPPDRRYEPTETSVRFPMALVPVAVSRSPVVAALGSVSVDHKGRVPTPPDLK